MSVTTETDKLRGQASEHIDSAMRILMGLYADRPWGWDELTSEAQEEILVVAVDCARLRKLLNAEYYDPSRRVE